MSNTFTAQELADFYQKVADGGEAQLKLYSDPDKAIEDGEEEYVSSGERSNFLQTSLSCEIENEQDNEFIGGPSLGSSKDIWRIKPTKKVIDLSVLIESGIDCEFNDDIGDRTTIGKLLEINEYHFYPYTTGNSRADEYEQCQPRMNHKHAWQGGECPLPEGFRVKVWLRDDKKPKPFIAKVERVTWEHRLNTVLDSNTGYDIIAFEVLGLADGYVMPWEKDNG